MFLVTRYLAYIILFLSALLAQAEELLIPVSSGTEIPVTRYSSSSATAHTRLLWMPTEYGIHGREAATASALAESGIEVWLADIHGAYFVPFGRRSFNNIPAQDMVDLILAVSENQHEVTLFATGRSAPLSLTAARQLQTSPASRDIVKSAILMHPNFYADTTNVGQQVEYLPITYATNLAIYIIQPALSGKIWQLNELKQILQQGGSDVATQMLPDVADGFNVREPDSKAEEKMYHRTPVILRNALKLLPHYKKPRSPAALPEAKGVAAVASMSIGLQPYQGNIRELYLNFNDLDGKLHTLQMHKNKVLLLNFWATWCPPCVKELPSLDRLQKKITDKNFKILAIDIGEQTETVKAFLKPKNIDLTVLTDPEGESVSHWNLLAFPSSFVIDKSGRIRYGLFGGLEWDNDEVIAIIQKLLAE